MMIKRNNDCDKIYKNGEPLWTWMFAKKTQNKAIYIAVFVPLHHLPGRAVVSTPRPLGVEDVDPRRIRQGFSFFYNIQWGRQRPNPPLLGLACVCYFFL